MRLSLFIDIYIVVRLKRTLEEKMRKSENLTKDRKNLETMEKDNEDAVNKVIKMVILNRAT